jgi:YHS domain-containing protein
MEVDETKAGSKSEYAGRTYYFCSTVCRENFAKNPQKYAK